MNIGFIIGLVVGATIGATIGLVLMSILTAGKLSDLEHKIALLKSRLC